MPFGVTQKQFIAIEGVPHIKQPTNTAAEGRARSLKIHPSKRNALDARKRPTNEAKQIARYVRGVILRKSLISSEIWIRVMIPMGCCKCQLLPSCVMRTLMRTDGNEDCLAALVPRIPKTTSGKRRIPLQNWAMTWSLKNSLKKPFTWRAETSFNFTMT
uniref:Integrase catalytic domain-containing protein n=1 Tax=Steinernema glaseri TaxID=37863 RepID=A0A1I8AKT1_9BILA